MGQSLGPTVDQGAESPAPLASNMSSDVVVLDGMEAHTKTLVVHLKRLPRGGKVLLDGAASSVPLRLAADGKEHLLRVTAPGFQKYTMRFVARPDLTILRLRMKPRGSGSPAPPTMRRLSPGPTRYGGPSCGLRRCVAAPSRQCPAPTPIRFNRAGKTAQARSECAQLLK